MAARNYGRYQALKLVGRGLRTEVFRGRETDGDRAVAIKVVEPPRDLPQSVQDEGIARLFEAVADWAALHHPNIVGVYDHGVEDGTPYIVMEYVGESLATVVREGGPLAPNDAARAGEAAARALLRAHSAGLVHGDLTPHNLLRGTDGVVKVKDFGIAGQLSAASAAQAASANGFVSPERIQGAALSPAMDQFALGATVYLLLTGNSPFARASLADTARAVLGEEPQPAAVLRPELDPAWDRVLSRALAKTPSDRFVDAGAMAALFTKLIDPDADESGSSRAVVGGSTDVSGSFELVVTAGPDKDATVPLVRAVEIGRERGDLALTDPTVSSRHCSVVVGGDGIVVEDHGSRNGTWVGQQRITRAGLAAGSRFAVGSNTHIQVVELVSPEPEIEELEGREPPPLAPDLMETHPLATAIQFALKIANGPLVGRRYPVIGVVHIGRNEGQIQIPDPGVSVEHAVIDAREPSRVFLRDCGSTNGTWIGERRVTEAELSPGDTFQIGGTRFVLENYE